MIDFSKLEQPKVKDKTVCFRLTDDQYKALRRIDANLSTVMRFMVEHFLKELDDQQKRYNHWSKKP